MKSIRIVFSLLFVAVALAAWGRADEKEPAAAKPGVCACDCGCSAMAGKDKKDSDVAKACGCTGTQTKPVEKVMPKSSYNRKS